MIAESTCRGDDARLSICLSIKANGIDRKLEHCRYDFTKYCLFNEDLHQECSREHLDISLKISTKCAAVLSLAFKKSVSISHLYMSEYNLNTEILDIFRKSNGDMLSTLVELDISENFFTERATLLR